jgi:hypothetical protein
VVKEEVEESESPKDVCEGSMDFVLCSMWTVRPNCAHIIDFHVCQ